MEWYRYHDEWSRPVMSVLAGRTVDGYEVPTVGGYDEYGDCIGYRPTGPRNRINFTTALARRATLRGRSTGQPTCLAWRPENDRIFCGLGNGEIALYSGVTLECEDMKRVLVASSEVTTIVPLEGSCAANKNNFKSITRHPRLLLGDASGTVHVTTTNLAPISLINIYNQKDAVYDISVSGDELKACVGVRTAHPALLDIESEKSVAMFKGLGFGTCCFDWHPTRDLIVAGSKTHELQLWDPRDANVLSSSFDHKGIVVDVAWHPTNEFIFASISRDHLALIWDVRMKAVDQWLPVYTCKLDETREVPGPIPAADCPTPFGFQWGGVNFTAQDEEQQLATVRSKCPWCFEPVEFENGAAVPTMMDPNAPPPRTAYPTAMKWHPTDPTMFVVGDSGGVVSFWRNGRLATQVAHVTEDWAQEIVTMEWNSNGTLLTTAVKGNVGGSVNFWKMPPRWGPLNMPGLCGHPAHFLTAPKNNI